MEFWLPVPGYEGLYAVSDLGRVRSLDALVRVGGGGSRLRRGRVLKQALHRARAENYVRPSVHLSRENESALRKVAQLVLEAFVGPKPEGKMAAHGDGDPLNNRLDNLRWATPQENADDMIAHGTRQYGSRHPRSKITEDQVLEIRRRWPSARQGEKAKMAREFDMCISNLKLIATGKTWGHVDA